MSERARVHAHGFDFCVHAPILVWTAVLYRGEKRSAPRFTSDQPSVLSAQRTLVPPVSGPNTPFSVLTPAMSVAGPLSALDELLQRGEEVQGRIV